MVCLDNTGLGGRGGGGGRGLFLLKPTGILNVVNG